MRLQAQKFSYLSNMSFRGPEHLWVEWDTSLNPERHNPQILDTAQSVRIGESTRKQTTLSVRVNKITHETQHIMSLQLVSLQGKDLPTWTAGAHVDVICGTIGLTRQYSLCGDPSDTAQWQLAVLK
jgi:hypothetical protein